MIKKYVSPLKGQIIKNMVIKITGTLLEVLLPVILAHIVDRVTPTKDVNGIVMWGVIMLLLAIAAWYMNVVANRMASRSASIAIQNIRQDLFERSMTLSARQIDKLTISSLESRLTSDTYAVHSFLGATLRMGLRSIILFLGGVIFSVYLSPRLSLVLVLLILPLFILVRFIFSRAHPLFRKLQLRLDEMVQVIRENIRGIKVSKAMDKVDYEKDRYAQVNESVKDVEIKAVDQMAMMSPMVNTILYGGLSVVLIWAAYLIDKDLLKLGVVMAYLSYFIQITNSLMMMNRMFNMYNRAQASVMRIEEVVNLPKDENQIHEGLEELPEKNIAVPEIEFRNVTFSYLGVRDNAIDISFKLYSGQTLGIMGATGSGKSTIIRLLLRQYDIDQGQILIRGIDIRKLKKEAINKMIGIVFQNDFLFKGTIKDNIDFGRRLDDIAMLDASDYAQAREFIDTKEGNLEFELASRGVNLSGGQKQRLLITRALASKAEILIFDDSSSALDFETEQKFRKALEENYNNTTKIIVAQRISSVINAEEIIFLEDGKIIARGRHEDLLETCQPYQEIAQMQMGLDVKEG